MARVLIADDHQLIRGCIRRLLAHAPSVEVVGEALDFFEGLAKAQKTKPDVLILDIYMALKPGLTTSELAAQVRGCAAKVLGISFAIDDEAKTLAADIGVLELLDKMVLDAELVPAIMRIAALGKMFPPSGSVKSGGFDEMARAL